METADMTPQSAKAKGRALQKLVRELILNANKDLLPDDVRSTSMGAGGEDLLMSPKARETLLNIQVECKNQERINLFEAYKQAQSHGKYEPLLVVKKNNHQPLAVIDAKWFFKMLRKAYESGRTEQRRATDNP